MIPVARVPFTYTRTFRSKRVAHRISIFLKSVSDGSRTWRFDASVDVTILSKTKQCANGHFRQRDLLAAESTLFSCFRGRHPLA